MTSFNTPALAEHHALWIPLVPYDCPACNKRHPGGYRLWDYEKRCDCGQLLFQSVYQQLEEQLGSRAKAEQFRQELQNIGYDREDSDNPSEYGMMWLLDPATMLSASRDRRQELMKKLIGMADDIRSAKPPRAPSTTPQTQNTRTGLLQRVTGWFKRRG